MASAANGYFGIGVETTAGTSVAPTKFLPVKSVDFDVQQEEIVVREIAGSRQAQLSFGGSIRPTINFETALYPSGAVGQIFRGLFGAVTTAAAPSSSTAFVHTFADAGTLPSFSMERSDVRGAGGLIHERIPGCKIESAEFSAEFGAEVNMSVSVQGLSFPEDPATKPGSITLPVADPFIFTGVSVDIDGVPSDLFKSVSFAFNNTLEPQEALRGTRTAFKIHEGALEATLSGTMIFDDNTIYNLFKTSEEFTVAIHFEGQMADATNSIPYGVTFSYPRVKVLNFNVPMEAEGVMEADVEFTVSYDRATQKFVTVTLTNLDPANTYNT